MVRRFRRLLLAVLICSAGDIACADQLAVIASRDIEAVTRSIATSFQRGSGRTVFLKAVSGKNGSEGVLPDFDVAILPHPMMSMLSANGAIDPGSVQTFAASAAGLAIKRGAPNPNVSDEGKFLNAIATTRAIAYDPNAVAGTHFEKILRQTGVDVDPTTLLQLPSEFILDSIVSGQALLGVHLVNEISADPRVVLVGIFPPAFRAPITFSAGVSPRAGPLARQFITHLRSPEALQILKKGGFELAP